jgi:hypothetical protein
VIAGDLRLAWVVFGVLVVVAAMLAGIGLLRAMGSMRVLNKRIEGYSDLPLVRGFATTERRLQEVTARFGEIEAVLDRAHAALASIDASIASLRESFRPVGVTFGLVAEDISALRAAFASRSRGTQTPGS